MFEAIIEVMVVILLKGRTRIAKHEREHWMLPTGINVPLEARCEV